MTTNSDSDEDKPNKRIVVANKNNGNNESTSGKYVDESDSNSSSSNIESTDDDDDEDDDDYDDEEEDCCDDEDDNNDIEAIQSYHDHKEIVKAFAQQQTNKASMAKSAAGKVNQDNINSLLAAAGAKADKASASFHQVPSKVYQNVTSNDISERCYSIKKILQEQHNKWYPLQDPEEKERGNEFVEDDLEDFWTSADGYNLDAYNEVNGMWPLGAPLPLPDWSEEAKAILHFDSVWQYEDLNALIESKLQRLLEETHYDTVNIFTDFYKTFKRTRRSDLKSFFQFYDIPINRRHHMCVSLAFEIIARIIEMFPILQHYLYVVSCEEQVNQHDYIASLEEVGLKSTHAMYMYEKEHVMVAMKISVAGREGIMLLDPGYHVSRAVTIMKDQSYPHTGWFTQSKEKLLQRDYCYSFSGYSYKYVEWHEREVRGDDIAHKCSVVYVEKPYITAIDVTVRRNLAYNFRSLVSRDAKGNLVAGLYLPVLPNHNEAHFTLFYNGANEQRVKTKFMLNVFKNPNNIPDNVMQHLEKVAPQLKMKLNELIEVGKSLHQALTDQDFLKQLLSINEDINNVGVLAADN